MAVNISVDLTGITWGELRKVVELAKSVGLTDDREVYFDVTEDCCCAPLGISLDVPLGVIVK